jgi:hypothetical protein
MPDLDPAALGEADTEGADSGTPLTTGAGAGTGQEDDGGADDANPPAADDAGLDDGGTTGDGPGDASTTTSGDGGDSSTGDDGGATTDSGDDMSTTGALPLPSIDLSGWYVVQTASDRVIELPPGTELSPGQYLVIGRNASLGDFNAFWGAVPAGTVYLNGAGLTADEFPVINGDETFELRDAADVTIDGPSSPLLLNTNAQRIDPTMSAGDGTAWTASPDPNGDASPGAGQLDDAAFEGLYISEVSDAVGVGAYAFEFIEIYYDG